MKRGITAVWAIFFAIACGCDNKPDAKSESKDAAVPQPSEKTDVQPKVSREEFDKLVEAAGKDIEWETIEIPAGELKRGPLVWTMKVPKGGKREKSTDNGSRVTAGAKFQLNLEPKDSDLYASLHVPFKAAVRDRFDDLVLFNRVEVDSYEFIAVVPVGPLDCRVEVKRELYAQAFSHEDCLVMLKSARSLSFKEPVPADPAEALKFLDSELTTVDGRVVAIKTRDLSNRAATLIKAFPDLEVLNLTRVVGSGLVELAGLKKLKKLNLFGHRLEDEDLRHLAAFPELESLDLSCWFVKKITGPGLRHLGGLKKLRELRIEMVNYKGTIDADLAGLSGLTSLKKKSEIKK